MQIDRQQRFVLAGVGFHGEGNRHGHRQIMPGIVEVGRFPPIAAFAPLADDDDARIVKHRGAMQRTV
ncbi:hypothetical protein D9M68_929320 [compost metagenome]